MHVSIKMTSSAGRAHAQSVTRVREKNVGVFRLDTQLAGRRLYQSLRLYGTCLQSSVLQLAMSDRLSRKHKSTGPDELPPAKRAHPSARKRSLPEEDVATGSDEEVDDELDLTQVPTQELKEGELSFVSLSIELASWRSSIFSVPV